MFDFASCVAPETKHFPISDNKCIKILIRSKLKHDVDVIELQHDLNEWRTHSAECLGMSTKQRHFNSLEKSREVGNTMNNFYSNLSQRDTEYFNASDSKTKSFSRQGTTVQSESEPNLVDKPVTDDKLNEHENNLSGQVLVSDVDSADPNDFKASLTLRNASNERPKSHSKRGVVAATLAQTLHMSETTTYLIENVSRFWITSAHLALMSKSLSNGCLKKTEHFGSFRVELVVALYSRVVDLYNFAIVFGVLSAYEVGCIYCRVGILHFFNPLHVDIFY